MIFGCIQRIDLTVMVEKILSPLAWLKSLVEAKMHGGQANHSLFFLILFFPSSDNEKTPDHTHVIHRCRRNNFCPILAQALTLWQRWYDLVLHIQQSDINQSDLQLYLTDITSQGQRDASSNYTAAPLPEAQPSIEKAKTRAVRDFNKCREHCMGKVLLSQ